jgi:simple sugar transport system ATP-binding protein
MMVGGQTETAGRLPATPGAPVLALDAVTVRGPDSRSGLEGVSLTVNAGEIVGVAGVSGNGQGVLTDLLSGLRAPDRGVVRLDGAPVARFDPRTFLRAGVGRIPEDRHHEGVVGSMSVAENLLLESLDDPAFVRRGFLRSAAIRDHARAAAAQYDIRGPGPDAEARLLSGGNIQKLVLARVFAASPRLIVADQPTRGLDIGAAQAVARRLLEARGRGAGVVLVSEDLDEILALSDRIVVMHDGRLAPAETRDRGRIGLLMAGEAA